MQAEEAIEIEDIFARDVDAGAHRVIGMLSMRHNDVEAVGCAALEDHHQALGSGAGLDRAECRAGEKTRNRGCADDGHSAVTKENATCDGHSKPRFSIVSSQ